MNKPLEAAWEVGQFLVAHHIPHALIGGLAVQQWGSARLTVDADFTIAAPREGSADLVRLITGRFPSRVADPQALASRARMMLVTANNGVEVDVSLALPGYEDELFRRAVDFEIEPGKSIRLCSAEDLIIHKAVLSPYLPCSLGNQAVSTASAGLPRTEMDLSRSAATGL